MFVKLLLPQGNINFVQCKFSVQIVIKKQLLKRITIIPWQLLDEITTYFSEGFFYPEVHLN